MNRKAAIGFLVAVVVGIALLLVFLFVFVIPLIKVDMGVEKKCEYTEKTISQYQSEIEVLINDFDTTKTSAEKEKKIVELYKEFKECFFDYDFENYMKDLKEEAVFKFIFVMKKQKYYDKTTLKIAQEYLVRFKSSAHISEVQGYVNEAKTAT